VHINYPQVIRQEPEQLRAREQQLRGTVLVARVRLIRLLKTGQAHNLRHAAALLGYSTVQVTRWWERYRQGGLPGLLKEKVRPGRPSRMTAAAWRGLQQQMKAGRISRLEEARQYLRAHWKIDYASVNGIWRLFRQRRVKFKTGRRRHRQADAVAQEAFKKTFAACSGKSL
jgi:transposase